MNLFDIFWASLATLLIGVFICFMVFVTWIYYDAALSMRAYAQQLALKNSHLRKELSLKIDHDGWQELMENAEEVI